MSPCTCHGRLAAGDRRNSFRAAAVREPMHLSRQARRLQSRRTGGRFRESDRIRPRATTISSQTVIRETLSFPLPVLSSISSPDPLRRVPGDGSLVSSPGIRWSDRGVG